MKQKINENALKLSITEIKLHVNEKLYEKKVITK